MFQLRRILLSGLVALLMVGMVTADEPGSVEVSGEAIDGGIGFYSGVWNTDHTRCIEAMASNCFRIWLDFDMEWLINLFT